MGTRGTISCAYVLNHLLPADDSTGARHRQEALQRTGRGVPRAGGSAAEDELHAGAMTA